MPILSPRTRHRLMALRKNLAPVIAALDAIPDADRGRPMSVALAGAGWRVVEQGRRVLRMPPLEPSIGRRFPGELVVAIGAVFGRETDLNAPARKASSAGKRQTYPRCRQLQ